MLECPVTRVKRIADGGLVENMCIKPAGNWVRWAEWIWYGSFREVGSGLCYGFGMGLRHETTGS